MEALVGCGRLVKELVWYGEANGLTRADVKKVSGSGKSFGPVGWRHVSLEEKGTSNVTESAESTFGLAVLLGSVRT
jgi:hypothetical protein